MTIKQQGGIFGRNPTFNNVDVEGTLTVNGEPISDFGTMAQQDATSVNIDGGSIDGVTLGTNSAVTEAQVDNININGNTISSTDTDGNVTIAPNGAGVLITTNADIVARDTGNNELKIKAKSGGGDARTAEIFSSASAPSTDVALGGLRFYNDSSSIADDIVCQILAKRGTNNNNAYLEFSTSQGGRSVQMLLQHDGNLNMTGGGNIIFNSGKGIDFSATSGTGTSELFDDYEEGNCTLTLKGSTTDPTTPATTTGSYTKVGNLVHVSGRWQGVSVTGAAGNISIDGLPYASVVYSAGSLYGSRASSSDIVVTTSPSSSSLNVYDAAGNLVTWASTGNVYWLIGITYKV